MPKTTKTTRKASSASAKKSGLKRRFDLTNKKLQFFIVIGIVAILGGGYFTFKSFAARSIIHEWRPPDKGLKCDQYCDYTRDSQKNWVAVWKTRTSGSARLLKPTQSNYYTAGKRYYLCAGARGHGAIFGNLTNTIKGYRSTIGMNTSIQIQSSSYVRKCTSFVPKLSGYHQFSINVSTLFGVPTDLTIATIDIERDF